jgi:hypothetical protein
VAYSYAPKIRLTPPAGAQVIYDLSLWQYLSRAEMRDGILVRDDEMLDLSVQQTRYGARRQVFLEAEFPVASTSNEADLIEIIHRSLDENWLTELSLDGGTTYRAVILSAYETEDMAAKKIGRAYRTVWTVQAVQEQPAAVMGGAW